ncbi:hypothetical protein SDC9_134111 [bioreactor metagenome]|uniref:Uncharacterized protein n=1 Tax=bioreactor metagenome TaxID=1076179 RepID=A0A645DD99_9ZZZZ
MQGAFRFPGAKDHDVAVGLQLGTSGKNIFAAFQHVVRKAVA